MKDSVKKAFETSRSKWAISIALHALILILVGSCVVIHSKHPVFSAFHAELQPTTIEEEKDVTDEAEMPEEMPSEFVASSTATGGASVLSPITDIITAETSGPTLQVAPNLGTLTQFAFPGAVVGKGLGAGAGAGFGTLGGIRVPLTTVVIMDTSGSMIEHNRAIYFQYGKVFPNTPLITIPSSKAAQIAEGIRYAVDQLKADSIFVLSDFQDLYRDTEPEAAAFPLVSFLKSHDVSLYLCTTDKSLPKVLDDYAKATGASKMFGEGLR